MSNSVYNWLAGRNRPSAQTLRLWAMRTGVPYGWLRKGELADPTAGGQAAAEVRRPGSRCWLVAA